MSLLTWITHPRRMWFHHQNPPQPPQGIVIVRCGIEEPATVVFHGINGEGIAQWEIVEAFRPWRGDQLKCEMFPAMSGLTFGGSEIIDAD